MAVALTMQRYLCDQSVAYDCLQHKRTGSSMSSAKASHVSGDCLAKAVVLKHRNGYVLAIIPASRKVTLDDVGAWLQQPVGLATEDEIVPLFPDCAPGAVPAIAAPYGLRSVVDESLMRQGDIYFEAGDHRTLIHVSGEQFRSLTARMPHGRFSNGSASTSDTYYGA